MTKLQIFPLPALSLGLVALCALGGCRKDADPSRPRATDDPPASKADRAMQSKLQLVVGCENGTFTPFENSARNFYADVQDMNAHSEGTPWYVPYDRPFFQPEDYRASGVGLSSCAADLEKAASLSPAVADIDAPARDAASALRALEQPLLQFNSYLAQRNYRDDQFAQGKKLAVILNPLVARILKAGRTLEDAANREEAPLEQHRVDSIAASEGHSLRWQTQRALLAARRMNDQIQDQQEQNRLTPASVDAAIQPLQAAYDDAQTYVAAHPELRQRKDFYQPLWFLLAASVESQITDGKELRRALNTSSVGITHSGSKQDEIKALALEEGKSFNGLIDNYNNHSQSSTPQN